MENEVSTRLGLSRAPVQKDGSSLPKEEEPRQRIENRKKEGTGEKSIQQESRGEYIPHSLTPRSAPQLFWQGRNLACELRVSTARSCRK
jgi:hypothetical protein